MNFTEYSNNYINVCNALGISISEVEKLLKYARVLYDNGLPIIYDQTHFSKLVGYDYMYILSVTNQNSSFYIAYNIPKKNGEIRIINEPYTSLKEIQKWILNNILIKSRLKFISPVAKAYIPGQNIKDNARFHKGQRILVCIDLHDFFGSINYIQVFNVFKRLGYNNEVATLLGKICIFEDTLPQGAPTSPMLSNLVFKYFDDKIFDYCKNLGIRYTRYADDLTFSGDFNPGKLISFVRHLFINSTFKLNEKKTKVVSQGGRQEVTGVIVNKKIQTASTYRRKIRQEIYYVIKFGVESHINRINYSKPAIDYLYHLLGKINFVLLINDKDSEMQRYYNYIKSLLSDYKKNKYKGL